MDFRIIWPGGSNMVCNKYLEDFKIDLLGFGWASMAHRSEGLAGKCQGKQRGESSP